ncbi:CTP synthase [Aquimixticola soesokkakensis]|uniref:CTP synthase (glutamine hydrolyzing) n=1 Tax=Aquimixticola soesokkakensis TaxID=1519096 RepID=A0A1Y5RW63_9RHOB|nr:gamma-glutamyl-gamma-aminobutyrate hydrolase family protein [Aquimixticola soesokkakensis]SLN26817.1 CTP synthase [Aquimixticola soesokkakensis]
MTVPPVAPVPRTICPVPRTIYLVSHTTQSPALDGMLAGVIAAQIGARMLTLDTAGGGLGAFEACQHVLATGALTANGTFWFEWASGQFAAAPLPPSVIAQHPDPVVVLPVNAAVGAQVELAERLLTLPARGAMTVRQIGVQECDDGWRLVGDVPRDVPRLWWRDDFGRPTPDQPARATRRQSVHLLIIGAQQRLRHTYPAVLAALGDAAQATNLDLTLDFWDPAQAPDTSLPEALGTCDGVLLPGGADMAQVGGQIRVARHALARDLPLLGLCLGMQTITTALAQLRAGFNDANMAEAAPDAQTKVFRRLAQNEVSGGFRIGLHEMRVLGGTRLARIMAGRVPLIHTNHRYVLDPGLVARLETVGLRVCALQKDTPLVDAIEVPDQRFCLGLQGHPELMTRRAAPAPLFTAFLTACA